jgi:hypothetical protein
VGESGMIRSHMGKNNRSVMVAVCGTPCAIPSRNNSLQDTPGYYRTVILHYQTTERLLYLKTLKAVTLPVEGGCFLGCCPV